MITLSLTVTAVNNRHNPMMQRNAPLAQFSLSLSLSLSLSMLAVTLVLYLSERIIYTRVKTFYSSISLSLSKKGGVQACVGV